MHEHFRKFASRAAELAGTSWAFLIAVALIVAWAVSGPFLGFSDVWQLTINTGTTIITFLMVFLIQNAQNRDSKALHLKIDELLRANVDARNSMLDLEHLTDEELARLQREFERLRGRADEPLAAHADELAGEIEEVEEARAHARQHRHNGH